MAREIKLSHAAGETWRVTGLETKAFEAEHLTAYDARDVEPLVEAARGAAKKLRMRGNEEPRAVADALERTLQPFDSEEEK